MQYFRNGDWVASILLTGLGASVYYGFAIVWPSMVAVLYSDPNDPIYGAWLAAFVGLFIVLGQVVGGFSGKAIGHLKWQCVVNMVLGAVCFGSVATCGPDTKIRASVLISFGVFFIGWVEGAAITIVTLCAPDQAALGSASGVAGSIRFLISSVAATVYNVILSNRLAQTIPTQVPPAVINAGLPESSVAQFISGFSTGSFQGIPGLTDQILAIGTRAYQEANSSAYRTVFLSNIAFSGVAIICTFLLPNVDKYLTNKVAATLHQGKDESKIAGQ
jgi:hypothetical protein